MNQLINQIDSNNSLKSQFFFEFNDDILNICHFLSNRCSNGKEVLKNGGLWVAFFFEHCLFYHTSTRLLTI